MPIYRCENCGGEAEHPTPKCVPCGLDAKAEPRAAAVLTELATIHFDPPHPKVTGWGLGHAACDPKIKIGHDDARFSGQRDAVNCQRCKTSALYAAAEGVTPGVREDMKVGPKTGPKD